MELTVDRRWPKQDYTIGILYIDGDRFCETLEDTVRPDGEKIPGRTAIPAGRYRLRMDTVSPRFKNRSWAKRYNGIVPRLEGVPDFTGVLIHPLNKAEETDGCIGVGNNRVKGMILDSQKRYFQLMDEYLIPASNAGDEIWVNVVNN
jgi:hypothetical protein